MKGSAWPTSVGRWLQALGSLAQARLDRLIHVRRARGTLDATGFCGYGTSGQAVLEGRVLGLRAGWDISERDSRWRNFRGVLQRFASREVAGVAVQGTLNGQTVQALSDTEGYFRLSFSFIVPQADGWHTASLGLPERGLPERGLPERGRPGRDVQARAPVRLVAGARFGVISDLDDTVVVTGATKFWQMARTVLLGNAHTRLPFPGVGALYRALVGGPGGDENNPVFYVSSSPWNLFDVLWTFLEYRHIPLGPLLLRDWGLHTLYARHASHKLDAITRLLELYSGLPFVLVGDSGEQDPEIYREVARRFRDRILAVYIRDVSSQTRDAQVLGLRAELRAQNIDLVLAADSLAAAHHAHALGLIGASGVREVGEAT